MTDKKAVYSAIASIAGELAKTGISKDRKNQQQGYAFRGIDEIYNHLAPLLKQYGLCILPYVESRELVERVNSKGTALFYVTVRARFSFVAEADGSSHEVVTYGEAMDSGDKATNKAMSAAYKYACMQSFCIPTEGDNDADATTHEVAPRAQPNVEQRAARALEAIGGAGSADALSRLTDSPNYRALLADLDGRQEKADLMNAAAQRYDYLTTTAAVAQAMQNSAA